MKIVLLGYGKMGQTIEKIALEQGHEVVLKIDSNNRATLTPEQIKQADVVIEFTRPEAAKENVLFCLDAGVPVVSGTTGWNEELQACREAADRNNTAFLHASNFSVGVNLFFAVNTFLAGMMNNQPAYEVKLEEVHHTQKKDAPSGTAITLAEQIIGKMERKEQWSLNGATDGSQIPIVAKRIDQVPGTHHVRYTSAIDDIEIIHTAHTREGFARGAVLAAAFVSNRKGNFDMRDVLGITY